MGTALLAAAGVILLLLIVSGFFSGSETALTAVSRGRMHQLEKDGSRSARDVNFLVGDRERVIGAILLGNTFLNILASSFATWVLESQFGERAVAIATVAMTVLILMFAEVLPKTLAIARTDRFALAVAQPMRLIVSVLAPIVGAVQWMVWRVLGLVGIRQEEAGELIDSHDEIRGTVNLHHEEGAVGREHRDMITGILDLRELQIADVMVHRRSVTGIDADLAPEEMFKALIDSGHTRVPVWRETQDNIIGVLRVAEVAREYALRGGSFANLDILSMMQEPWFVPETTTLEEQLRSFRAHRSHFALVVDEYGALQGIVTREDILDEILRDIPDENEAETRGNIRKQKDGSYIVDGTTPIRDLNRELDWNLPDDEATTIAGLVIYEARTIPEAKQRFSFYGYMFEILRRQRNQITAIKVTPPNAPATPPQA
ncbi:MAG: HlyC/CorC family transporter [Proteobacteria bacterium]|nr:HlyC/CorC family transporter [Pseudomonadota bacterium]